MLVSDFLLALFAVAAYSFTQAAGVAIIARLRERRACADDLDRPASLRDVQCAALEAARGSDEMAGEVGELRAHVLSLAARVTVLEVLRGIEPGAPNEAAESTPRNTVETVRLVAETVARLIGAQPRGEAPR